MLAAPNCPQCLEPMEPHPTFDQWWCEGCQIALAPEDAGDDLGR